MGRDGDHWHCHDRVAGSNPCHKTSLHATDHKSMKPSSILYVIEECLSGVVYICISYYVGLHTQEGGGWESVVVE